MKIFLALKAHSYRSLRLKVCLSCLWNSPKGASLFLPFNPISCRLKGFIKRNLPFSLSLFYSYNLAVYSDWGGFSCCNFSKKKNLFHLVRDECFSLHQSQSALSPKWEIRKKENLCACFRSTCNEIGMIQRLVQGPRWYRDY